MKCPYQTKVIHFTEYTGGYLKDTVDKTEFGDCAKIECPFYYTTEYRPTGHFKEHCRKAESEK